MVKSPGIWIMVDISAGLSPRWEIMIDINDKLRLVKSNQFRCANTLSLGIITKIQESPNSRLRLFGILRFFTPYWARTMTILFGNTLYLICGYLIACRFG